MPIMYFYKTGYNLSNRPFSRNALSYVLAENEVNRLNVNDNYIYPNILPVDSLMGLQLINSQADYCEYYYPNSNNTTNKRYAFITAILPNAVTGGFMVHLQEDIWTTYGLNMSGFSCKIDGTIVRGHVNDWENGKATLKYTTDEAEEEILVDGIVFSRYQLSDNVARSDYAILYILVNAGANYVNQWYINNYSNTGIRQRFGIYNLYICGINKQTGFLTPIKYRQYDNDNFTVVTQPLNSAINNFNVSAGVDRDVSATGIVSMWVSDILPQNMYFDFTDLANPVLTIDYYQKVGYEYIVSVPQNAVEQKLYSTDGVHAIYCGILGLYREFSLIRNINTNFRNLYRDGITPISVKDIYEEYLQTGIVKVNTNIYNPRAVVYDGTTVIYDYSLTYTDNAIVTIDPTLRYLGVFISQKNKWGKEGLSICTINVHWQPLQHNSYWTQLNARQATVEANRTKTIGQIQYTTGIIKSSVGVVGSLASSASGIASGDVLKTAQATTGIINAGVELYESVKVGQLNLKTLMERSNIIIEKNRSIIEGGLIQEGTYSESGFYYGESELYAIQGDLTDYNYLKISKQLHKYGYVTQLPFDNEFLTKHQRQKFNFILAENTVVRGLPLNYCRDIEDMFNNGVTLWTGSPQTYEVVNYPLVTG